MENIQNTHVIREAIRHTDIAFDRTNITLEPELVGSITKIIKSPTFRKNHSIKNLQQFVDSATISFLKEIEANRKNLRDNLYEILTDLDPFCREIAMLIVELQHNTEKITFEKIMEHAESAENIVVAALDLLCADGYIEAMDFKGQKIYWIPS